MDRRRVLVALCGLLAAACGFVKNPNEPSKVPTPTVLPPSKTLLQVLREAGYNAMVSPYGQSGAARIAINDDVNWNFRVNGQLVGIGPLTDPTLNVPSIPVPNGAKWQVVRP